MAFFGLGGVSLAVGGAVFALDVHKKVDEKDLSVIGQGTPVILQIHDPQCPSCGALQAQTRRALRAFDDDQLIYRVADIRTEAGAAIAYREALPHVTLALFDGAGRRVHVVQGVTPAADLIETFRIHLITPAS